MEAPKLSIEAYYHNNYQIEVECMEGDQPTDRVIQEADLYKWLEDNSYCTRGYHDQMGEWVEVPTNVYDYMENADWYVVLADYLNTIENRTLRLPVKPKPLPQGALLPNLAGLGFMSTINRPQSKRA